MSARLKRTIIAASCLVAATGCELVAGIQDLAYSPDSGAGTGDDATMTGDVDSAGEPPVGDETADRTTQDMDASEVGSVEAGDAPLDTVRGDGASEADAAEGAVDGNPVDVSTDVDAGEVGMPVDASDAADVGAPGYTVSLTTLDGGALKGLDGGPLTGELIDDIDNESTPGWILPHSGRTGTWFTYSDGTAGGIVPTQAQSTTMPSLIVGMLAGPDGNATNLGAHVTGNGAASYAGLGFNLNGGAPSSYDATAYQGITFWGRIGGSSGFESLKFAMPDRNTSSAGGVCPTDASSGCGDYFAKTITFTPTWTMFVIYFNQLGQAGFGLPKGLTGLDAAHVYSCQFQPATGTAFDIWVDDVYLIDK